VFCSLAYEQDTAGNVTTVMLQGNLAKDGDATLKAFDDLGWRSCECLRPRRFPAIPT
jgi:hypothetical protein